MNFDDFSHVDSPGAVSRVPTMVRTVPTTHYPGTHPPPHHGPVLPLAWSLHGVSGSVQVPQAPFGFNVSVKQPVHVVLDLINPESLVLEVFDVKITD